MLILAFDSTAQVASAALCEDSRVIATFHLKNGNTHSETLLPMAKALLDTTGYTVDDVELFAVSHGPGSFTGVRIGAATVKGLAFGKQKTVIGVSTLEALATNVLPANALICPVMNARRGQVYNALFEANGDTLTRLCPDRAISVADLEAELATRGVPFYLLGDGADMTRDIMKTVKPLPLKDALVDQNAISVARCALLAYQNGVRTTDKELSPVYLRLPQAERERLEREASKS